MSKKQSFNKATPVRITTVAKGENWFIDRVRNDAVVEFKVYIDGIWMADRDTKEEAQAWRDEYVYSQLKRAA